MPLFMKWCAGGQHMNVLYTEAMIWLRPADGGPMPGSRDAHIVAALQGCICVNPDSRLTATAAGALLERARSEAASDAASEAIAQQASSPASPPDALRRSALPPRASKLPMKLPLKPPMQPQSPRRTCCICTGDDCNQLCAERCELGGRCPGVAQDGGYCLGCNSARAVKAANRNAAGAFGGGWGGGADGVPPQQQPNTPAATGEPSHKPNSKPDRPSVLYVHPPSRPTNLFKAPSGTSQLTQPVRLINHPPVSKPPSNAFPPALPPFEHVHPSDL